MLQNSLAYFTMIRENSISKQQLLEEERKAKIALREGRKTMAQGEGAGIVGDGSQPTSSAPGGELNPEVMPPEPEYDHSLANKDGVWVKWCLERCETEEQKKAYEELKDRIHNKHNHPEVGESCMLRFLEGYKFNVDEAEEKLTYHLDFMKENKYWHIDESRIPNMIDLGIMCVHKEDVYERPIIYLQVAKLVPGNHEFEELQAYLFWNSVNTRKAFKPHVESHLAIYDVKGLGKKNMNMGVLKKLMPELENNLPELCAKMFIVRPGFILNMLWGMVKPFIHPTTLEKIQFLKDKQMGPELTKLIEPENLPNIYGGEDTEFEQKYCN